MAATPDIALVSPATTFGLRYGDGALARQLRQAGATCRVVPVPFGPARHLRRSMSTTDLVEALAARRACRDVRAGAFVYSTITAALLQPVRHPHAIRFDGIAAANRPGVGGAWQRRRERPVLARADLLLPWGTAAAAQAAGAVEPGRPPPTVALSPPIELSWPAADAPDVVAYAANPDKRGLDVICAAWREAGVRGGRLGIAGLDRGQGLRALGGPEPAGVEWLGQVERPRWLALVAGARAYLSAARIEDWGLGQMEALAAGTPLVTAPAPGGNAALGLARELEPRFVAGERTAGALGSALTLALDLGDGERADYAARAGELLAPYSEEATARLVADEVLPRLLSRSA